MSKKASDHDDQQDRIRDALHARVHAKPYGPELNANPGLDPLLLLSLRSVAVFAGLTADAKRQSGETFRVHPTFVAHTEANAFITAHDGVHLCGITTALGEQLIALSRQLVAQPGFFAEIGSNDDAGARLDQRLILAEDLAHMLLRFCWLHELYHGLNGHVGLLQQINADATLLEMPETGAALVSHADAGQWLSPADRHALEFDADRTAFWVMFRVQEAGIENVPTIAARPLFTQHRLALFAAIALIGLFEQAARAAPAHTSATHPSPSLRLHNFIRTLASYLSSDAERTHLLLLTTFKDLKAAAPTLPGLPDMDRLLADLGASAFRQPLDEAEQHLIQLRERLHSFVFRQGGGTDSEARGLSGAG